METDDANPLYVKTKAALRSYIAESKCTVLPGERELVKRLNVSRTTVRKAIQDLVNEGRLRCTHGKGNFVVGGSSRKSMGIALLAFEIDPEPYMREAFQLLVKRLVQKKVYPIVLMIDDMRLGAEQVAAALKKVDFVVLGGGLSDCAEIHNVLEGSRKKVVVLRHKSKAYDYDFIEEDRELAYRLITEHLLSLGHRRVATLFYLGDEKRMKGIQDAFAARGLEMPADICMDCRGYRHAGYEAMGELLARSRDFTAVITQNDSEALGVMERCFKEGIRIPEDVSITGFDNLADATLYPVPLTSCGADLDLMLKDLTEYLCGETGEPSFKKVAAPILRVRKSTTTVRGQTESRLNRATSF